MTTAQIGILEEFEFEKGDAARWDLFFVIRADFFRSGLFRSRQTFKN